MSSVFSAKVRVFRVEIAKEKTMKTQNRHETLEKQGRNGIFAPKRPVCRFVPPFRLGL
jgi:hypothetical protein